MRFTIEGERGQFTIIESRPLLATNLNCEQTAGLSRRTFLALLPAFEADGIKIIRKGKLRAVLLEDLERWIRARAATETAAPATPLDGEAAFLNELGYKKLGGWGG